MEPITPKHTGNSLVASCKFKTGFKVLLSVYKHLIGLAAPFLGVIIAKYAPARSLRSSAGNLNY